MNSSIARFNEWIAAVDRDKIKPQRKMYIDEAVFLLFSITRNPEKFTFFPCGYNINRVSNEERYMFIYCGYSLTFGCRSKWSNRIWLEYASKPTRVAANFCTDHGKNPVDMLEPKTKETLQKMLMDWANKCRQIKGEQP